MDLLLRRFLRAGVRRGLGGNWYWFLLAGATFFLRRVLNDRTSVGVDRQGRARRAGAHHGARPQDARPPSKPEPVAGPLAAGERVLLIDPKDRRYLLTLVAGRDVPHPRRASWPTTTSSAPTEGCTVTGSTGRSFLVLRPTLSDVVLKMPRGAQVIYPKDLGAILIAADIGPGPAGARGRRRLGRAVDDAAAGRRRPSSATSCARTSPSGPRPTCAAALGPDAPYRVEIRDVTEGIDERGLDRVLLDMPEPHKVVARGGGRAAARAGSCWPTCPPSTRPRCCARRSTRTAPFGLAETQEILRRTWHVEARSVRPDHRMVGHTGFLTTARRLGPSTDGAARALRAARVDGVRRAQPGGQSRSMKMHSPGHSSEASTTASSSSLGHRGHAGGAAGVVLDVVAFLHVGEAVVEQGEHGRRDLLAQAVARAEILVDPDLHVACLSPLSKPPDGPRGP